MDTQIKTETIKQGSKTENISDHAYRITVNDTVVRIRFTGSDSLSARLASAFSAML